MSHLTDTLRKELNEARQEAQAGWDAFEGYKKTHGEEKLSKDKDLFEEAHRLHGVYGEAKERAGEIESRLFKAMDMDSDGPSLKDVGEEAGSRTTKEVDRDAIRSFMDLTEKVGTRIEEDPTFKAFRENKSMQSDAMSVGSLINVADALKRTELKTLLTGVINSQPIFNLPDMQAGRVEGFDRIVRVMTELITVGQTDTDKVEWVQQDSFTNNAAETAEAINADTAAGAAASTAPESAIAFSLQSTTVQEIKHFIPATKRSLADIGQLRTIIDQELLYGLSLRLDNQIINGSGAGVNLKGILNTSGIQTQAKGADTNVDAIHKAMTKLAISGYANLGVLLHPNDWQLIRLAKDVNGQYYYGPPSIAGGMQLWGYPVNLSVNLAAGTGIVSDFKRSCTLWLRDGAGIAATDSHSDWFLKGIIAVLAAMRGAFAVVRPRGVCTVTGIV